MLLFVTVVWLLGAAPCRLAGSGTVAGVQPNGSHDRYEIAFTDFSVTLSGAGAVVDGVAPVAMHGTVALRDVPLKTTKWIQVGSGLVTFPPETKVVVSSVTKSGLRVRLQKSIEVDADIACDALALTDAPIGPVVEPDPTVSAVDIRSGKSPWSSGNGPCGDCGVFTPVRSSLSIHVAPSEAGNHVALRSLDQRGEPWITLYEEKVAGPWLLVKAVIDGGEQRKVTVLGWVHKKDVLEGQLPRAGNVGPETVVRNSSAPEVDLPPGTELLDSRHVAWGTLSLPIHARASSIDSDFESFDWAAVRPLDDSALLVRSR